MFADAIRVGDTTIERVMLGDVEVWSAAPSLPVVQITGTTSGAARAQFRAACTAYGTTYTTVAVLPFLLDTSQATILNEIFNGCAALTTVPDLDTSQVTSMNHMFFLCESLTTVPDLDTSGVTSVSNMFRNCSALTDGNVRLIGKHPSVYTGDMILGSGLTREPFYDTAGNPI